MYETYAPKTQGKVTGAVASLALTAGMGAFLAVAMATDIIPERIVRTEIVTLPPEEEEIAVIEPAAVDIPPDTIPLEPVITTELPPPLEFDIEPTIIATPVETAPSVTPGPVTASATGGPTTSPSLRSRSIPPYPPASVRAGEEGTSTVEVCVSASGQVTSASLAQSSGHPRLDEAALRWLKTARFNPAKREGQASAMCGYQVAYEWNLENAS